MIGDINLTIPQKIKNIISVEHLDNHFLSVFQLCGVASPEECHKKFMLVTSADLEILN